MKRKVKACAISSGNPEMLDGSMSALGRNSSRSRRAIRSLEPAQAA
jgi:hypothetical protein